MYIIYDTETFAQDWLIVCKLFNEDKWFICKNDNAMARAFFNKHKDDIFVSFNGKSYDQHIIKAIVSGASNDMVKDVNDWIIGGRNGWQHPYIKNQRFKFNQCDLMDDCQVGISLKSFEAHMGMNIEESEVDFNIDRKLTEEEMEQTIYYCKWDVLATEKLYEQRKAYLENKIMVGKMAGLNEKQSLALTNARLTAEYLQAKPIKTSDERDYKYPDNLLMDYIPKEVVEFFDRLQNKDISDDEIFNAKYKSKIGDCNITLGFGGIHGDNGNCIVDSLADDVVIVNEDVGSYYPHLMVINGYVSRAISSADDYKKMLEQRMAAKREGNKQVANALKLVCNTTYGCLGSKYNNLYDPLMMRSVCISGQLYLLELANHIYQETNCNIIQLNTDGIMFAVSKDKLPIAEELCEEWQKRTGFTLERDDIAKIIQKDVNNYIEIKSDGSFKCKGGYLVRGISQAGAFNINNNATIVAKAIVDYFTKGTFPEITVMNCNDLLQFQLISKTSSKFKCTMHNGVKVNKCNRVYASKDFTKFTLFKMTKDDRLVKVAGLPEHCVIDNSNELTIDDIDKRWYIDLAYKKINDFLGDDLNGSTDTTEDEYL